jgi:hypothetical protein
MSTYLYIYWNGHDVCVSIKGIDLYGLSHGGCDDLICFLNVSLRHFHQHRVMDLEKDKAIQGSDLGLHVYDGIISNLRHSALREEGIGSTEGIIIEFGKEISFHTLGGL